MDEFSSLDARADAQAMAHFHHRAAQELLLAYQSNKEAKRHHASGAVRAALHHARLSLSHSWAAYACLSQVLEKSSVLSAASWSDPGAMPGGTACKGH